MLKNKILWLSGGILLIIVLLLVVNFNNLTKYSPAAVLTASKPSLAFCPNIDKYGGQLVSQYGLEEVRTASSMDSFQLLKTGAVDVILSSRPALAREVSSKMKEKLLQDNYLLAYQYSDFVSLEDLADETVRTYLPQAEAEAVLPIATNIVTDLDRDNIKPSDLEDILLLKWSDYQDGFGFISPYNSQGLLQEFRGPFLYYFDDEFEELSLENL
ncbi:MAG: hypothetical protein ACOCU8_01395 [Patescibacteria group bacterium]